VFPEQYVAEPQTGGYQFMISANILRGRYREGFDHSHAFAPGRPLDCVIRLPQVNHRFGPSHRLIGQVHSSWFPLYGRNPQTFVVSIMEAKPSDYRTATHSVHASATCPSHIELHVADQ